MTELLTTGNAESHCDSNAFEKVLKLRFVAILEKFRGLNLTEYSLRYRLSVRKRQGRGSEWGYLYNTKHFIFWLCSKKQLNVRHFNSNSKKFFETVNSFPETSENESKKGQYYFV